MKTNSYIFSLISASCKNYPKSTSDQYLHTSNISSFTKSTYILQYFPKHVSAYFRLIQRFIYFDVIMYMGTKHNTFLNQYLHQGWMVNKKITDKPYKKNKLILNTHSLTINLNIDWKVVVARSRHIERHAVSTYLINV